VKLGVTMEVYDVEYYRKADGTIPVKSFIDGLPTKAQAKITRDIMLLSNNGLDLREPHSKPLGDGIFELRCQSDGNQLRVLYFFMNGKRIILTNGFTKKTQRTPVTEISIAKKYRKDFLSKQGQ